ncbi:M56 family metallopeptidase [Rhodanobacter sp. Si-c]|uniref:M56 family metallopeptidase n=1 Tax=Rhodanobacter lycopersici TaxID=3162487 RepID=A0ABV3QIS2_9GAMM
MNDLPLPGIESLTMAWAARGWLALLAFTAAVLVVAALRKPCRRWFGAERAFQLWLLPPLALLASQLPHATASPVQLPPLVYTITSALGATAPHADVTASFDWRAAALPLWLTGVAVVFGFAVMAQRRYRERLHGATPMAEVSTSRPVVRAASAGVGPALVGVWRSRIVLPADFRQRYDATEQALILAHETTHARRGDGWWCLLAQMLVALLWCHPLAWWALAALRHDQELACDAAVLREHGAQRRSYANAMLKTQSAALALPVGCTWSPRHPLTERIAMLKLPAPNRQRRHTGIIAICGLTMAVAGSVYAASTPVKGAGDSAKAAAEYQLNMNVEQNADDGHASQPEGMSVELCMVPGKTGTVANRDRGWQIDATPSPEGSNRLRIDVAVMVAGKLVAKHRMDAKLGELAHVTDKGPDGVHDYTIEVTPLAGCPARVAAEASPARVTEHAKNASVRVVAEALAATAGWTLVNPDALGNGSVTLSFKDMPAGTAMQRLADLAGMKPVFEGKQVRFEPK